jgi:hypothetical protein
MIFLSKMLNVIEHSMLNSVKPKIKTRIVKISVNWQEALRLKGVKQGQMYCMSHDLFLLASSKKFVSAGGLNIRCE